MLRRRHRIRREGSLAAALAQSMALAVIGTAGAYPSWVLVQSEEEQMVLGAAWAISQVDPDPGSPLLGPGGDTLMYGIALCCLFSVLTGSLALMLDFLGRRRLRSTAPFLHGLTALLIACAAALGSCLLGQVRVQIRTEPELRNFSIIPGQSLFLACLACALAATATGLSCSSPARVEPARSSWDFGRLERPRAFYRSSSSSSEESPESSPASVSTLPEGFFRREKRSFAPVQLYDYMNQADNHPRKPDPYFDYPPADHLLRKRPQQQQSDEGHSSGRLQQPKLQGKKSLLESYWDSTITLARGLFQGNETSPATPQVIESNFPEKGLESAAEQEARFSGRPDSELQVHMESEAHRVILEEKTSGF